MNIRDIARISGYSLGTVSRVLNGHPNVSDRARERVLAVVEEQNYEPNSYAKHLKLQDKAPVAILVKGSRNVLFADILERVQAQLTRAGEEARVSYLDEDADEVRFAVRYDQTRHPRAILFLGGDPSFFKKEFGRLSVPAVLLTNRADRLGFPNLSSFSTDDARAAADVASYLMACGHTRIGIIGGSRGHGQISSQRIEGAVGALERQGVPFSFSRDYEPCRYSMDDGYEAIVRLMMRTPDLTAVIALGDVIAMGAMRAVFDMGLSVPGDLSITGFDGISSSQFCVPRLTTVKQDTASLARLGVEQLLRCMEDPQTPSVHRKVPFNILKRESVRKLL